MLYKKRCVKRLKHVSKVYIICHITFSRTEIHKQLQERA